MATLRGRRGRRGMTDPLRPPARWQKCRRRIHRRKPDTPASRTRVGYSLFRL